MINIFVPSVLCRFVLFPSLLLGIVYLQVWGKTVKPKESILLLLNFLLLILIRIPFVFDNNELQIDESGIIGQAISVREGLYVWQGIHPTTAGPFNTYVYYWFCLLTNMPINYISAHLLSLIFDSITLGILYFSGKYLFGQKKALFALTLTLLLWNIGNNQGEIFHYASEKFSLIIISILIFLLFKQFKSQKVKILELFVSGLLIALVPFAKPQGIVLVGVLGLFYLGYAIYLQPKQKFKLFAAIASGAAIFLLAMLIYTIIIDGWTTFLAQIMVMADYGSSINLSTKIAYFNIVPVPFKDNTLALVFTFVFASAVYSYKKLKSEYGLYVYVFIILMSLTSFYTVIKPGTFFVHYFHYLIPFLFYLIIFTTIGKTEIIALTFAVILVFNYFKFDRSHSIFDSSENFAKSITMKTTVLGSCMNQLSKPNDKMAIWGWTLGYFPETQLAQAVSFHHVAYLVSGSHQELFKQQFLDEIKTNKPTFFLDTSVNGFVVKESHEKSFPKLAKYIQTNYTLIKNDNGDRLFIRNDRVNQKI